MKDRRKGAPGLFRAALVISVIVSLVVTIGWHFIVVV